MRALAQTSAHYQYRYNSCLRLIICFFLGQENDFHEKKNPPSFQNELSDINKTYIDIGNSQKFEL